MSSLELRRRMMTNKPSFIEDIYPLIAPLKDGSETEVLSTYETAVSLGTIDIVDTFNRSSLSNKRYIYTISNSATSFTTPNADCNCVYFENVNGVTSKQRINGNKIVLVKNADYWKSGSPKAETLVYKIIDDANVALVNLKSGQLDMTNRFPLNEAGNFKDNKALSVCNEAGPGFKGYVLNTTNNKFKDKKLEKYLVE